MTKLDLFAPYREQYAAEHAAHGGPQHWRSLEHKEQTDASRDMIDQEFPHGSAQPPVWSLEEAAADPSFGMQRRDMLKLMGASMALAGVGSACVRRPEEEILPYTRHPEDVIPGIASHYATAIPGPNGAVGVIVESHEGRPTKVEGNPDHPASRGRADIPMQSSVLQLYDPDRSTTPKQLRSTPENKTWADWDNTLWPRLEKQHLADGGAGLAILTDTVSGPTEARLLDAVKGRFPAAQVYSYDPMSADETIAGTELVFGNGTRAQYDLSKAKVILSLDSDFLVEGPDHLALAAGFGEGRSFDTVPSGKDAGNMNRLYAVEGVFSVTGTNADHRLRVASSEVPGFAKLLAKQLLQSGLELPAQMGAAAELGAALATSFSPANKKFVPALAKDLIANRGKAVVLVGERQPAAVHALAHLLNIALGAAESGVLNVTQQAAPKANVAQTGAALAATAPAPVIPAHVASTDSLASLVNALNKGQVKTVVVIRANPAYTAPETLAVKTAFSKATTVVHAGLYADETAQLASMHLPTSHYLEAWGDAESWSGHTSVTQPLVEPLHQTRSILEILAQMAGISERAGRALVEGTWSQGRGVTGSAWRQLLHDGVSKESSRSVVEMQAAGVGASGRVGPALAAVKSTSPSANALEVVFTQNVGVLDGRMANLGWNQELPDPITKLCWDNALIVGPALAKTLGIGSQMSRNAYAADQVTLTVGGQSIDVPVFVLPGLAPFTVSIHRGYGRTSAGFIGNDVGVNVAPVLPKTGAGFAAGATLAKTGKTITLAGTQDHFSVEGAPIQESTTLSLGGRPLYRDASVAEYTANPLVAKAGDISTLGVNVETKVSSLIEADSLTDGAKKNPSHPTEGIQLYGIDVHKQPWTYDGQAWGMTIDLTACIGCNACAIACQAENNIPIVGRDQVLVGREMHWIRIDRYFTGDVDEPKAAHQAVPCMQCENAPCEPVCPVAATVHDEEGLNAMVYNRCIGTRYCANNCPFKVRRFNFLDFTKSAHLYVEPPHDDRKRLLKMVRNPNVTVRFRGVMEKCSYCTQRIQAAKYAAKNRGEDHRDLPDGAVTPACAQTCPTNAIAFGNINGKAADGKPSEVARRKLSDRNYEMLSELNVRPRTTYLAKLRNTNPELV